MSLYTYIYMFVESCWLCVLMCSAGDDVQYNFGDINARGVWPVKDLGTSMFVVSFKVDSYIYRDENACMLCSV